jgi:Domain of unknown function (DUF4382)
MIGGIVGVIVAIGLIAAGMYAFGGNSTTTNTTSTISSSSSTGQGISSTSTGSGSSSSMSSSTGTGGTSGSTGVLQLSMIDPPHVPADVVDVYVNYSAIQVHIANAGNESGWYNATSSGTLNLTNIVNASTILGSVSLPNGTYNIVRFNITSAIVTVNSSSGVLTNHTANVPSGKIQTVITGGVNVRPNTTSALLVDISPTVTGANGSYTLVPSANAHPQTPANNSSKTTVTQNTHTTTVSTP